MNLPISWLASALPASVAIQASSKMWKETSQFFGHLANQNQLVPAANGPLAPTVETSRVSNPDEPIRQSHENLKKVQRRLEHLLQSSRSAFGFSGPTMHEPPMTVSVSADGQIKAVGAEPLRTNLEVQIQNDPNLLEQLRDLSYSSRNGLEVEVR